MRELEPPRQTGKIARLIGDYGFVTGDDPHGQDFYFKVAWFRGALPLKEGEAVSFQTKTFGDNVQAHHILRLGDEGAERRRPSKPRNGRLLEWAYLGYLPNVLGELQGLALKERWEFSRAEADSAKPLPILWSYLRQTFARLVLEDKILVNEQATFAAFNTGLVDSRYEPIHALFTPNSDPRAAWQLAGFCIPGEGGDGQNLVRHFAPLPDAAHYFGQPIDLLYDARAGKPELSWTHIVIERIDRYPVDFIDDYWPASFEKRDPSAMAENERKAYFVSLGNAIEADKRTYRRIMGRVKDAVDLSIKRVSWNFKTAVPQYYPPVRNLQLLLPLALTSDDKPDLALAVEKTQSGNYLGHTVLPLDWAYSNARLICRPDSDWLDPDVVISPSTIDDTEAGL